MFNVLDWIMIALMIGWVIRGYTRGFVNQIVSLLGLFIAYVAAYLLYDRLAPWVAQLLPVTSWENYDQYKTMINMLNLDLYLYNAIAFAIIFFGVKIGLSIASFVLNIVTKVPGLNTVNKSAGAVLAIIEMSVLVIIAINVFGMMPPEEGLGKLANESYVASLISEHLPTIVDGLRNLWQKAS